MKHRVRLTRDLTDSMKTLDKQLIAALYSNFIKPISNGLSPLNPNELEGKYKPSWASDFPNSSLRQVFIDKAKLKNAYHYHVGYKIYQKGKDKKYPGSESAGIAHTRVDVSGDLTDHVILDVCADHPSPFTYPYLKLDLEPI